MPFADVAGRQVEYRMIPGDRARPPLVFLHEGLGSVALWRDFPDKVAGRLGGRTLLYSRFGYGQSEGISRPRTSRFMHEEALDVLPVLLDGLAIEHPLLIGHSDGASIALIHAAASGRPVAGLVLMAPHVVVEQVTVDSIARVRETYHSTDLRSRLAKYHARVDDAFLGWADIWLLPEFRDWSIQDLVVGVSQPMLLIQGRDDEYGTLDQIDRITARARAPVSQLILDGCGHSPHRDQEAAVLDAIVSFARALS
jgi:pimeloyl-ACP methyl ester carboxylesterase